MKTSFCLFALAAVLFIGPSVTQLHAEEQLLEGESLGKITLGQKSADTLKLLGKPEAKGKDTLWEAIGEWVQDWKFPAKGLSLAMSSAKQGGAKTVFNITAKSGCGLATARGIKIGSTEAAVRKAYQNVEDKTNSSPGESFVAGSIYGGVIFTFKGGKVSTIFIGAAAE